MGLNCSIKSTCGCCATSSCKCNSTGVSTWNDLRVTSTRSHQKKKKKTEEINFNFKFQFRPLAASEIHVTSSPGVCCRWCCCWAGSGTIFRPSREALRWFSSRRNEPASWARGKSSRSLWPANSNSTEWRLLSAGMKRGSFLVECVYHVIVIEVDKLCSVGLGLKTTF